MPSFIFVNVINNRLMRIYFKLSPNTETVPFNYQSSLVGAFHRWLGENELHDDISLYSLSWLDGARKRENGFEFPQGAGFFISSPLKDLHQRVVSGMFDGQHIRWGMEVREVTMQVTPDFGRHHRFLTQSPVFIQRRIAGEQHPKYFFPHDPQADDYLTETLQHKLRRFGLPTDVSVAFDPNYRKVGFKKIRFHQLDLRAAFCPVIVTGSERAVQFAWEVGVGNSTGIGFGALR
jgi:CRISPR-associated endoribonuclease Cas6